MLKLERRAVDAFLPAPHQTALSEREKAATRCATDTTKKRGQKIRDAWDNFRQGKTAKGTDQAFSIFRRDRLSGSARYLCWQKVELAGCCIIACGLCDSGAYEIT